MNLILITIMICVLGGDLLDAIDVTIMAMTMSTITTTVSKE
jgi:hypothetical protein